jgi:hypothetical protein
MMRIKIGLGNGLLILMDMKCIELNSYFSGGGNYNIFGKKQWMWIDVEDDYN